MSIRTDMDLDYIRAEVGYLIEQSYQNDGLSRSDVLPLFHFIAVLIAEVERVHQQAAAS